MMSFCEKSKNCLFFPAKASFFFKFVDLSLDRVITVLSNDGGAEEKPIRLMGGGGGEIRPNELTQFPLQDLVYYTYRNEHLFF